MNCRGMDIDGNPLAHELPPWPMDKAPTFGAGDSEEVTVCRRT